VGVGWDKERYMPSATSCLSSLVFDKAVNLNIEKGDAIPGIPHLVLCLRVRLGVGYSW
jgi:hypothetical protein